MRFVCNKLTDIWNLYTVVGECWIWQGNLSDRGYGHFWFGGKDGRPLRAHRISWELTNGPIPAGILVCHKCDNPPCIRPQHLFLGNESDNIRDSLKKGRKPGKAKLTPKDVLVIRSLKGKLH